MDRNTSQNQQQTELVTTFDDLMSTSFEGATNALCWHRELLGNFKELVEKLSPKNNITEVSVANLLELQISEAGAQAREVIIKDLESLTKAGAQPTLNLLRYYERDEELDFIATDVYSYHVDRSPVPTATILCTYYGNSSDILPNSQAEQLVLVPEIREKLIALYGGNTDGFEDFLTENYFDLHYRPKANAQPINLGVGHLWKLAVEHPGQKVLPCIHRAPVENGDYRLLLIC